MEPPVEPAAPPPAAPAAQGGATAGAPPPGASPAPEGAPPAALVEAQQAFLRGDWRAARAIARRERSSSDPARREAAREMAGRFAADPQLVAAYLLAALALLGVVWRYLVAVRG